MAAELLRALLGMTLVSSVAILLVLALRRPLRAWAGARAAYWLWLLVPVLTLASLLPMPAQVLQLSSESFPAQIRAALAAVQQGALPDNAPSLAWVLLLLWLSGVVAMILVMAARQISFSRSLGDPVPGAGGIHHSDTIPAPMLVGALRPRIIVPRDFENRYSPEEQELVLAHERAHLQRRDVASNALASASLCLFWFNPLVYRALDWMRTDQELACDAQVLRYRPGAAHSYAKALLKTQLATESAWRLPVVCQWQSAHPLKERIAMLKRPLPRKLRHLAGIVSVVVLSSAGGYLAWAGQDAGPAKGAAVLVTIKVTVTDPRTQEVLGLATQYVVHSGELPEGLLDKQPVAFACRPFLPGDPTKGDRWQRSAENTDRILVECELYDGGKKAFTPSMVAMDGRQVVVEYVGLHPGDTESRRYKMEVTATTSAKDIEAAKTAAANRK